MRISIIRTGISKKDTDATIDFILARLRQMVILFLMYTTHPAFPKVILKNHLIT
jgi:hypothetical protein